MSRRPVSPTPLHLLRLAQAAGGEWVSLPDGAGRVVALVPRLEAQTTGGWLVCLQGSCVVDLPTGSFVKLGAGEAVQVAAGWEAVALVEGTVLLLI